MKNYPIIKISVFFICGIIIEKFFRLPLPFLLISLFSSLVILIILFSKFSHQKNLILIISFIAVSSIAAVSFNHFSEEQQYISENIFKENKVKAFGTISRIDLIREGEVRFYLSSDSILFPTEKFSKPYLLLCRLKESSKKYLDKFYNKIEPGNKILIEGTYTKGREERNPGEFDYNKYLHSKGISGTLTSYNIEDVKVLNNSKNIFSSYLFYIRKNIDDQISDLHNKQTAALLKGLLLADRSGIDPETKTEFINSGVIHVLAVSGLHVGFIILICYVLFGRFNIYFRSILTIVLLFLFLVITGMPSSVFRAVVMAAVFIIAYLTNRSTNIINTLAIAALIILAINPADIFEPGFQLSFSAVLSIAIIFPLLQKGIKSIKIKNKIVKNIILFAAVSVSAQIGTMPFTLFYFGKLSLIAILANLIVIPLVGFIVPIAIFTLSVAPVLHGFAVVYAAANEVLTAILFKIVALSGNFNYSYLNIYNFTIWDSLVFYILITAALIFWGKFTSAKSKTIFSLLIILNLLMLIKLDNRNLLSPGKLNIMMIDVGQGDSFLLRFDNGETALIDAGNATSYFDNGEKIIMPLLDRLNIKKINYAFVSHLDADHYGGFISLIKNKRIKILYKPVIDSSLEKDKRFEKYLHEENIPIEYYSKSSMKIGGAKIYFLNDTSSAGYKYLSTNDKSGTIKIVYGKNEFLFTGDMEAHAEKYYTSRYKNFLHADLLKVAHHGSKTSSSEDFLNYVKPKISLISDGIKNKFHHPSALTLQKLEKIKSKIYRTDKSGAVLLQSDGDSIKVIDWRKL